jgi:UPF0716 protein FxsA
MIPRFLLLFFILFPILEITCFIHVSEYFGLFITLTTLICTTFLGIQLLKKQGRMTLKTIQSSLQAKKHPTLEIISSVFVFFSGVLLFIPGFLTDILGGILMIPFIRIQITIFSLNYLRKKNTSPFNSSKASSHHIYEGEYVDESTHAIKKEDDDKIA